MYVIPCWDRSQRGHGRRASAWVRFAPAFRSDSAVGRAASPHTCHNREEFNISFVINFQDANKKLFFFFTVFLSVGDPGPDPRIRTSDK
jgi:hypothetical protein